LKNVDERENLGESLKKNPLVNERAAGSDPETSPLAPPIGDTDGGRSDGMTLNVGLNLHRNTNLRSHQNTRKIG